MCRSKNRALIEIGLVAGTPLRTLAARFELSHFAIGRHGRAHLPAQARAAILAAQRPEAIDLEALRRNESEGLLGQLVAQRARLLQMSIAALESGDVHTMVKAEAAIGANIALGAKLTGQLVQLHDVRHTSILLTPDYLRLRQALIEALRAFPEAARAVGAALHGLEADAAKDVTDAAAPPGRVPITIEATATPPPPLTPPPPRPPE